MCMLINVKYRQFIGNITYTRLNSGFVLNFHFPELYKTFILYNSIKHFIGIIKPYPTNKFIYNIEITTTKYFIVVVIY